MIKCFLLPWGLFFMLLAFSMMPGYITSYNGGTVLLLYAVLTLTFPRDEGYTFDSFIGMDCPPPNWNEGLDPELTKDLHLISQFHNLFQHMLFAITDFIYVREFRTEINIEIIK